VGIALGVVTLGIFIFATVKKRKIDTQEPRIKDTQIGISLQEQNYINKSIS
jgi:hypothetical protein